MTSENNSVGQVKNVEPGRWLSDDLSVNQVASCDSFVGVGLPTSWGRLFGGQILGQALVAAARTVDTKFHVSSLHAYFILAGDSRTEILYEVDRIQEGRSIHRRQVTGKQAGKVIFIVVAAFQVEPAGQRLEYTIPVQEHIGLMELAKIPRVSGNGFLGLPSAEELIARGVPMEADTITGTVVTVLIYTSERRFLMWRKHRDRLPDNSPWSAHASIVAFTSDQGPVRMVRQPYEWDPQRTGGRQFSGGASLDHSIHFHRRFRCDEWHLYVQQTDASFGDRGIADVRIYAKPINGEDIVLVASCRQEALIRLAKL